MSSRPLARLGGPSPKSKVTAVKRATRKSTAGRTDGQLLPKLKIEVVMTTDLANPTNEAIIKTARTGEIGDGKIFVTSIDKRSGSGPENAIKKPSNAPSLPY